jgi:hypothetical protein
MWSHYADGHKGFLLGLSPDFHTHIAFHYKDGTKPEVKKVDYVELYDIERSLFANASGVVNFNDFDNAIFFKKTKHWAKEKEYRLLKKLVELKPKSTGSDIYLNSLPMEVITSVVFGALMKGEHKKYIFDKFKNKGLGFFFQAVIFRDCPNDPVGLWPLNEELINNILKWKSRRFIMEEAHFDDTLNKIFLKSISQLPYYSSNHLSVEDLFKKAKEKQRIK